MVDDGFREIMTDPKSVSGHIKSLGLGTEAIVIILATAVFKTALAEEIFFRGFLAKRLIAITTFQIGNALQGAIFGIIHTLVFLTITQNWLFLALICLLPGLGAWCKTYLNEKMADGSIVPGWIAHASGNIISYSFVAFVL